MVAKIKIDKNPQTGVLTVSETEGGRLPYETQYRARDERDAVDIALSKLEEYRGRGKEVELVKNPTTTALLKRYQREMAAMQARVKTEIAKGRKPTKKELETRGFPSKGKALECVIGANHPSIRDITEPLPEGVKIMQPPPFGNPMYPLSHP